MRSVHSLLLIVAVCLPFVAATRRVPVQRLRLSEAGNSSRDKKLHQQEVDAVSLRNASSTVEQNAIGDTGDPEEASTASTRNLTRTATIISGCGLGIVLIAGTVFAVFITRTAKPLDTSGPIAKKSEAAKKRESSAALSAAGLESVEGKASADRSAV